MRLNRKTLGAAGSVILPLDPHLASSAMNTMMYGSSTINATAQVDATLSDLGNLIPVTITRSTTTATVTFPTTQPHTLGGTSDYIVVSGTGSSNLDGTYPIASVSSDTVLTYTVANTGATAAVGFAVPVRFLEAVIASAAVSATTPAVPAVSATAPDLYHTPFSALILKCTSYTAGTIYLDTRQTGIWG